MPGFPQYVPDFQIRINGDPMPAAVRSVVTGISYEDGKNAADRVEVDLANPDLRWLRRHIRGLGFQPYPTGVKLGPLPTASLAGEGTFDLDNTFELAMGYAPEPLQGMFEGEITGLDASFPNGGMPTLKLVAHDYLQRLSRGTYAGGFGFLPDFLTASILSARNLLIPAIDPAIQAASTAISAVNFLFSGTGLKQGAPGAGESDLQFIQRLAATYDADFWVEGDVLYLSRFMKDYEPRLTLTWGESLLDFSPKVTSVGQVAAVRMRFYLRELALSFEVTVGWDFDREALTTSVTPGAAALAGPAVGGPAMTIIDQPINSPGSIGESVLRILYELRKKLNQRLTGSGTAIGDPRIRAGAVIRLEGLGPDFSGDYRVASANHSIDGGGYRTTFQVFKEIIP